MADDLTGVLKFAYEAGYLKRLHRTGWDVAGVPQPESIAAHSFRVGLLAMLLAYLEGGDPGRAAMMGLLHDTQESRIGDVPAVGRAYVQTAANEAVTADQVAGFPPALARAVLGLVREYEGRDSLEASCARDADKLDCLLQAREYEAAGNVDMEAWTRTSMDALRTASGVRLGELAMRVPPSSWWEQAAAQYPQRPRIAGTG